MTRKYPGICERREKTKNLAREKIKWLKVSDYSIPEDTVPTIRVGIVDNVNKLSFKAGSDFQILDKNNNMLLKGSKDLAYRIDFNNSYFKIYQEDKLIKTIGSRDPLRIRLTDNNYPILLYDISYGAGYFWAGTEDRQYRGVMELYPAGNNHFHITEYLKCRRRFLSVVPAEMPAWWPDEAIKAQAIAARSYAMSNLGRHRNKGYDLCDTVHCAAYDGVKSETERTNKLILETLGEVEIHDMKVINTVFSSNSGGFSEKSLEIWGNALSLFTGSK